ncbi:MAG: cupin domain-containing protein [Sphaerochaetaceae bacterium]
MIEKIYSYFTEDEKKVEKIVDTDSVMINHIVLAKGDKVPDHKANSFVHMIVVRGTLTLELEDQQPHHYNRGTVINIPFDTFMRVRNENDSVCEFFVIKSPNPTLYHKIKF